MIRSVLLALLLAFGVPALATPGAFYIPADSTSRYSTYLRVPPQHIDVRVLAANTNENHTVPTGAAYVVFSSDCAEFYVKPGGTAAVPAADVTDGTGSELNPSGYYVGDVSASSGSAAAVTTLGIISPTACTVTMSWYAR